MTRRSASATATSPTDNYEESPDADFSGDAIAAAFVPEVVDDGYGTIDVGAFLERLRAGQPVLRVDLAP